MNKRDHRQPRRSPRLSGASRITGALLVLAVAAGVSMPAHAEYRCGSPSTSADRRACDMAKRGAMGELRRFIQRTASIYGLYFNDYFQPEEKTARRATKAPSLAAADRR
jgi:hypothetical protein